MILEIELVNYIRLSLKNIRYFKWTMKETVQILLGTNGSGKSAMMAEMSPLPAEKDNYYKGGKKRIVILHKGRTYELISDFEKGQNHYFNCDGENLNPGRTITVQKELVKEHFGVTTENHAIVLGREKFTGMKAARRKELFMRLCIVDYTYAVKLYKRIQEELNAMRVGIRLAKERLGKETILSVTEDELREMRHRLSTLTRESQEMYLAKNASAKSIQDSSTGVQLAVNTIRELKDRFSSLRKSVGAKSYIAPSEYQHSIDDVRSELASASAVYARLSEEFIKLSAELGNSEDLVGEDAIVLKDSIIADKKQAEQLLEQRKKPLEGLNPITGSGSMELVYETLVGVLTQLPSDPDSKLTSSALTAVNEKLAILHSSLNANKIKLAEVEHQERHLASLGEGDTVECPKCVHKWRVGYNAEAHEGMKNRIEKGRRIVSGLNEEIALAQKEQEQLSEYATLYREYIRVTRNTDALIPLWKCIDEGNWIKKSPQHALTIIELVRNDFALTMRAEAINDKIRTNLQRLKLIEHAQNMNVKEMKAKQDSLEKELGYLSTNKVLLQRQLQSLTNDLQQLNLLHDMGGKIRQAQEALDNKSYALIESIKNDIVDQALVNTHSEIAVLSTRINSIDMQVNVITDLNKTIESYEKQWKAYKALSDTLSPTDGLIAEGMLGFIRNFVARMNALIAKVWTYRMDVHDCSTEADSAELNYKFPLSTPNLPKPVEDVEFGSSGQKEIIDLAFVVIAAQCLGLDHGPLFLDEFGKTFDEAHQTAATQVITQLMEQLNFSQLFMISHYESCYGSFYNAQFTVLDAKNITLPGNKKINEYAEMTS